MTFDLVNTPLDLGVTRLEASAGTGKTFALAGIFLRLLVEEQIPASDILVVTFTEAALGADITVPTISGEDVKVRLAPGTPNGKVLRVKGRGITKDSHSGDLMITVEVQVPQRIENEAKEALMKFAELTAMDSPREHLKERAGA